MKKRIFAINGSVRKKSTNAVILTWFSENFDEVDLELSDHLDLLPHFNPDNDANPPQSILDFRKKIRDADGVLICTPEYVFSLPGCLKNAIEWCVSTTVFSQKPLGLIVAAASGENALEALSLIMSTIEAKICADTSLLIRGAGGKLNDQDQMDQNLIQQLTGFRDSFYKCL